MDFGSASANAPGSGGGYPGSASGSGGGYPGSASVSGGSQIQCSYVISFYDDDNCQIPVSHDTSGIKGPVSGLSGLCRTLPSTSPNNGPNSAYYGKVKCYSDGCTYEVDKRRLSDSYLTAT